MSTVTVTELILAKIAVVGTHVTWLLRQLYIQPAKVDITAGTWGVSRCCIETL